MSFDQNDNLLEIDAELLEDLRTLIELRDQGALRTMLIDLHEADIAQLLTALEEEERHYILSLLRDEVAAEVMLHLPEEQRGEYLAELEPQRISDIVEEMSTDDAADIVSELEESVAKEVLETLEQSDSEATEEIRDLLRYDEDSAGGRMTTDYVAVEQSETVATSIEKIRQFVAETDLDVHSLYVIDGEKRLVGIVRLQDLVLRPPTARVSDFMLTDIITIAPHEDQAVVAQLMQRYDLIAVPVLDDHGVLLGIVTFDDIADIIQDEASEDMLLLAGVTEDESLATSPLTAIRRRLPWLVINLGSGFVISLIISRFDATYEKLPVLAALMPIVAGMGGNAAIQAITVMIRGIALGEIGPGRTGRAIRKEVTIGLMNGLTVGIGAGSLVWFLYGIELGVVLAAAMMANLLMAGLAGALVPLVLRKLRFDPALSSGPIVTSLTDATGYSIFLGLSTLTLLWLLG